ncbi:MAG: hypothetical protein ACO3N0_06300 [bacterium]
MNFQTAEQVMAYVSIAACHRKQYGSMDTNNALNAESIVCPVVREKP